MNILNPTIYYVIWKISKNKIKNQCYILQRIPLITTLKKRWKVVTLVDPHSSFHFHPLLQSTGDVTNTSHLIHLPDCMHANPDFPRSRMCTFTLQDNFSVKFLTFICILFENLFHCRLTVLKNNKIYYKLKLIINLHIK
jgi:hypothetical protein